MRVFVWIVLLFFGASLVCRAETYTTWKGSEPDKAATAWFISRFVDANATFALIPVGSIPEKGNTFDIPGAAWRRTNRTTAFRSAIVELGLEEDKALLHIDQYIHALEFQKWARPTEHDILRFESDLALLREEYGAETPPLSAFFAYFDETYQTLISESGAGDDT